MGREKSRKWVIGYKGTVKIQVMDKQNWEDNEFQKKVRIKEEDLEWLKKTKGKKTIAIRLEEIIKKERYGKT